MKNFIIFTDIHGGKENFALIKEELTKADLIILCGDITNFGDKETSKLILAEIEKYNHNIIGIIGNCDYPSVEKCLVGKNYSISSGDVSKFGVKFIGLDGSLSTPSDTPNEHSEEYYKEKIQEMTLLLENSKEKFILVSHQPPYGTINDKVPSGINVGSHEIRTFIEKTQPLVCLTGHIHEGIGIDYIGKTQVVNPGPFRNGHYGVMNFNPLDFSFTIQLKKILPL